MQLCIQNASIVTSVLNIQLPYLYILIDYPIASKKKIQNLQLDQKPFKYVHPLTFFNLIRILPFPVLTILVKLT